ncbi:hypothetical protein ACLOJK_005232 [Asimina triloba]
MDWSGALLCLQDPIRHGHQDPEGHSVNGQNCAHAIKSPGGGHRSPDGILKGALEATRGRIGMLRLGQECWPGLAVFELDLKI